MEYFDPDLPEPIDCLIKNLIENRYFFSNIHHPKVVKDILNHLKNFALLDCEIKRKLIEYGYKLNLLCLIRDSKPKMDLSNKSILGMPVLAFPFADFVFDEEKMEMMQILVDVSALILEHVKSTDLRESAAMIWFKTAYPLIYEKLDDLKKAGLIEETETGFDWKENKTLLAALLRSNMGGSFNKQIDDYFTFKGKNSPTGSMSSTYKKLGKPPGKWEKIKAIFPDIELR